MRVEVLDLAGAYKARFAAWESAHPSSLIEKHDTVKQSQLSPEARSLLFERVGKVMNESGLAALQAGIDRMPTVTSTPPIAPDALTNNVPPALIRKNDKGEYEAVLHRCWFSTGRNGKVVNRFGEMQLVVKENSSDLRVKIGSEIFDGDGFKALIDDPEQLKKKVNDSFFASLGDHPPAEPLCTGIEKRSKPNRPSQRAVPENAALRFMARVEDVADVAWQQVTTADGQGIPTNPQLFFL